MKNIILIAPPAAGKGTISFALEKKYGIPHISVGDLLREEVTAKTEIGKLIEESLAAGNLVKDEITVSVLSKRLENSDCKKGYILDGFPRTVVQALSYEQMLEQLKYPIGKVIYLTVDKELSIKRIAGRISCPNCKAVFNEYILESMPKVKGICDECGTLLTKRSDDNIESLNVRFDNYFRSTEPVINYYQNKNLLTIIEPQGSKEELIQTVIDVIDRGI